MDPELIDDGLTPELRFGEADDRVHPVGDHWSWTETTWWSFNVPERRLGGWLYVQMRAHQNSLVGGAFVWDDSAELPWELCYYNYLDRQPLPDAIDLTDVRFPNGVRVKLIEPGMRYELGYRYYAETDFTADLYFEGIMAPHPLLAGTPPFPNASHFDQPGRVTGRLQLNGETLEVDCISVRDRSWGPRPERWSRSGRLSYIFGSASENDAFLMFTRPQRGSDDEVMTGGYLYRDGVIRRLASAVRRSRRRPDGRLLGIEVEGIDEDGRPLVARGEAVSRMLLPRAICTWNSLMRWEIDGQEGWGEDQDLWPLPLWRDTWVTREGT